MCEIINFNDLKSCKLTKKPLLELQCKLPAKYNQALYCQEARVEHSETRGETNFSIFLVKQYQQKEKCMLVGVRMWMMNQSCRFFRFKLGRIKI